MRIALLLRGISYCKEYKHPNKNNLYIDYKKSIENYKEYIYKDNIVDVFYHTYYSSGLDITELNNYYKPKAFIISKENELSLIPNYQKFQSSANSIMSVLNLFMNYYCKHKIEYDYIILTRFDLLFKIPLNKLLLEKNKFLINCMTENPDLMDDNFFISNVKLYKIYFNILCNRNNNKMLHFDYTDICKYIGVNKIKILIKGNYIISYGTPLYNIVRHIIDDNFNNKNQIIYNTKCIKYLSHILQLSNQPFIFRFIKNNNFYNIQIKDDFLLAINKINNNIILTHIFNKNIKNKNIKNKTSIEILNIEIIKIYPLWQTYMLKYNTKFLVILNNKLVLINKINANSNFQWMIF